jgi:sec-independent protein translocase protein TatC
MRRTKSKPTRKHARNLPESTAESQKLPFIAHIRELRKRLFYVAIAVIASGSLAYTVNETLTSLLLRPAGDQQFIYTTPGGGFDFLFKLCLYAGLAASIPVIVYQILRYLQPLIKRDAMRFIGLSSIASGVLAIIGVLFGYIYGLPAAMHFLLQGFSSDRIQALISIQSYMSFVMMYLLGAALLFQVPLVLLMINRIKPLKPRKLMGFQRWFLLIAFVLGALFSPSPNVQDQLMLAGPMIVMYQLSIVMIWAINRKLNRPKKVLALREKDAELRAERLANFQQAQNTWQQLIEAPAMQTQPAVASVMPESLAAGPAPAAASVPIAPAAPAVPNSRPRRYVQEFTRRSRAQPIRRAAQSNE